MKFLCLCYYETKKFEAIDEKTGAELAEICAPLDKALRESGHLSIVGSLAPPADATTVMTSPVGPQSRSGPNKETPEPLGAFFIIEAQDMDEATRIASLHPGVHVYEQLGGGIEVRAVEQLDKI